MRFHARRLALCVAGISISCADARPDVAAVATPQALSPTSYSFAKEIAAAAALLIQYDDDAKGDATTLLQGALDGFAPDEAGQRIDDLRDTIGMEISGLSWQISKESIDRDYALAIAATDNARTALQTGSSIAADGAIMSDSDTAVTDAEQDGPYLRAYVPYKKNLQDAVGEPDHANNVVYDWRIGVPALMQLISMRLVIYGAFDPTWVKDGLFQAELMRHHDVLVQHTNRMLAGLRCGYVPPKDCGASGCIDGYTCMDVNTGVQDDDTDQYVSQYIDINRAYDVALREMRYQMPLFEMQQTIDSLWMLAHPDSFEITPGIDNQLYPGLTTADNLLCLGTASFGVDNGTPVVISDCVSDGSDGDTQFWKFDRPSGNLVNVGSNKCLDVLNANRDSGARVQLWDCNGQDQQRWTWSSERMALQNALGTYLTVKDDAAVDGQPLVAADFNGSEGQHWNN
jgi:hypothetical protein